MNNKSGSTATPSKPAAHRSQASTQGSSQAKPQIRKAAQSGQKRMPPSAGRQDVVHRNEYYKDGNKKVYVAAVIALVALVMQVFVAYLGFTSKNERVYFATDKNGSLIKLIALGEPNQKDQVVVQWLQNALVDTFSFNFTNIKTRLNESTMEWFTPNGREQFLKALEDAGHLSVVTDGKMIMSLTLEHTPVLIAPPGPSRANGIYQWNMQVNAIVTFRTQSQEYTKKVMFTVTVERRSVMDNVQGLGISKIQMRNRS